MKEDELQVEQAANTFVWMICVSSYMIVGFSAGGKGYFSLGFTPKIRSAHCARRTAANRLQTGKACLDCQKGVKDYDDDDE